MQLRFLSADDEDLARPSAALPPDTEPGSSYTGPARVIVPTVRTAAAAGEALKIRVIGLSPTPVERVELHWRCMGRGPWVVLAVKSLGRGVYGVTLPPAQEDFEYYVRAVIATGKDLLWPAAAPAIPQTVVVWWRLFPFRDGWQRLQYEGCRVRGAIRGRWMVCSAQARKLVNTEIGTRRIA